MLHTDTKALRNLEIARKVAFMMAWHPRLGAQALIRRYVSKDVAKLIANRYMSADCQLFPSAKPLLLHKPLMNDMQIAVNKNVEVKMSQLELIRFCIVDKALLVHDEMRVQSPLMTVTFDFQENAVRHLVLHLARPDKDQWFIDWMNKMDQAVMTGLTMIKTQHHKRDQWMMREMFVPTFQRFFDKEIYRFSDRFPPTLRLRLPPEKSCESIIVYNSHRNSLGSFSDNVAGGIFKRGAEIRVIMRHVGVWASRQRITNQWMLEQILLVRTAQQVNESQQRFAFVIDDDDDEEFTN